jgi:hypothetical protein
MCYNLIDIDVLFDEFCKNKKRQKLNAGLICYYCVTCEAFKTCFYCMNLLQILVTIGTYFVYFFCLNLTTVRSTPDLAHQSLPTALILVFI